MPVVVKYDTRTVYIYPKTEAERELKEGKVKIYSVTGWVEVVGMGVTLTPEAMRATITTLLHQENEDGIVRVHCDHGVHRSAVAAILFLWSQIETVTIETVYDKVDVAYRIGGAQPSAMVKKTLVNSIGPLLHTGGGPIRRGGIKWDRVKEEKYTTMVKAALTGA